MKKSLTRQILFIISGIVAGAILLCWLLNYTILESYYVYKKEAIITSAYEQLNEGSKTGEIYTSAYRTKFERLSSTNNLVSWVYTADNTSKLVSGAPSDRIKGDVYFFISGEGLRKEIVKKTAKYTLYRYYMKSSKGEDLSRVDKKNEEYLVLVGNLEDSNHVYIRTPIQSIRENVKVSNRFFALVGIFAVIISIIVAFFVSRRITRPILMLTDISRRMVNLDFEARYERGAWKGRKWREFLKRKTWKERLQENIPFGKYKDKEIYGNEVDQLGAHINQLSGKLEYTISELKKANLELQRDIEQKIEIDEMRKEFLSNVSHELKTPIALIQGYAEGLRDGIIDDKESADFYTEVIMDEANKMNQMVKQLLSLNQLEFGNDQITMERFNMTELIEGVAFATKLLSDQREIQVELKMDEPIYVWGDEFKIEEVLTNFMSNAIYHCDGEKKISVFYTKKDQNILRISVYNTGRPIPEEDLERVWIKFYKVDKARTRAYGGSGIGLSIVKAIMDSHKQSCGVINKEDGVEFWFELSRK